MKDGKIGVYYIYLFVNKLYGWGSIYYNLFNFFHLFIMIAKLLWRIPKLLKWLHWIMFSHSNRVLICQLKNLKFPCELIILLLKFISIRNHCKYIGLGKINRLRRLLLQVMTLQPKCHNMKEQSMKVILLAGANIFAMISDPENMLGHKNLSVEQ